MAEDGSSPTSATVLFLLHPQCIFTSLLRNNRCMKDDLQGCTLRVVSINGLIITFDELLADSPGCKGVKSLHTFKTCISARMLFIWFYGTRYECHESTLNSNMLADPDILTRPTPFSLYMYDISACLCFPRNSLRGILNPALFHSGITVVHQRL